MPAPTVRVDPEILFYAFRYALGRMTYAAHDTAGALTANADVLVSAPVSGAVAALVEHGDALPATLAGLVVNEIDEAVAADRAGAPTDVQAWRRARATLAELIGR